MAEHKDLLDTSAHCHTPQGFAAASNDTALTKNSSGSLVWQAKSGLVEDVIAYAALSLGHTTNNATPTTMLDEDTYYIIAGTWTEAHADNLTTTAADGRITIPSGFAGDYLFRADLSMISSRSTAVVCFSFMKNGAYVAGTPRIRRKIGTGSDVGACSVSAILTLAATDYVQVAFQGITGEGWTDNDTVTVENAHFTATVIHLD